MALIVTLAAGCSTISTKISAATTAAEKTQAPAATTATAPAATTDYDPEKFYTSGGFNVPGLTFQPSMPDTKGNNFMTTEVFKDVYFMGDTWICCMVYKTPAGIIMWDAMEPDMYDTFERELKKIGLNSADIKINLISHGHGDHYGFARKLQDKYGTKVYMSEADIPTMEAALLPTGNTPAKWTKENQPKIDQYLKDGDKVTLGGVTFTLMDTPGHTPGSVSFFVPVTDFNGKTHTLTCWGGTSAPRDPQGVKTYLSSVQKYRKYIKDNNIDAFLSMHPFVDYSTDKVIIVGKTKSSDPLIQTKEQMDFFCETLQVYTQMKGKLAQKGINNFTTAGYGSQVLSFPYSVYIPEEKTGNGAMYLGKNFETQLFDNVYFVGNGTDACIIYKTKEGIVISDAMTSESDFTNTVKPAMESFGLDPKTIKAVMVTHGHADKFGFAAYVQKTYGAKVYMNKLDAQTAEESLKAAVSKGKVTAIPAVDVDLVAGSYKFGEFTFDYVHTPGHTPGCMSYLVNVNVNGKDHTAACWGGTTFNYEKKMLEAYVKSIDSFIKLCETREADAIISTHPYFDYSVDKATDLMAGNKEAFILKGDNTLKFALNCICITAQYKLKYSAK